MTDAVYTVLAECIQDKAPDQHVFTRPCGNPVGDFRYAWANACKHVGVAGLPFHDLRRTAARNLRRAGIAEGVIMKIGGWRTRSVLERYAIFDQNDIAAAMKELQANAETAENSYSSVPVEPKSVAVAKAQIVN